MLCNKKERMVQNYERLPTTLQNNIAKVFHALLPQGLQTTDDLEERRHTPIWIEERLLPGTSCNWRNLREYENVHANEHLHVNGHVNVNATVNERVNVKP